MNKTTAALEANHRVMSSLSRFYTRLRDNEDFPLNINEGVEYIDTFVDQVDGYLSDIDNLLQRVSVLLKILSGRKNLVSASCLCEEHFLNKHLGDAAFSKSINREHGKYVPKY